jgi:uncharacterized protein
MHDKKFGELKSALAQYESAVIAFSGGVDSTLLAKAAGDALKGRVLLVTASSSTYPASELDESRRLAALLGLPQRVIVSEELDIEGFAGNPPQRCYYCKKELFSRICEISRKEGFAAVLDGSNADDAGDYRPGRRACKELGVRSPLLDAGFTKKEIRECSARLGLPTASKPSLACLASRFPYGEKITRDKLVRVGEAEEALRKLGFTQLRVRSHGDVARIELIESEMDAGWSRRGLIEEACKKAGYLYVALDTRGYRTGAMNEALKEEDRRKG